MFKRKLFKRALPFILSVAMMFESLPATAMATESSGAEQMTETEALDEEGGEAGSEKESGSEEKPELESKTSDSEGSEAESGSEEKPELESKTSETVGSEESSGNMSEPESGSSEAEVTESSTTENTTTDGQQPESPAAEESKETEFVQAADADTQNTEYPTELRLKRGKVESISAGNGFTYVLAGEEDADGKQYPKFTTEYAAVNTFGDFEKELKDNVLLVSVDDGTEHERDTLDQTVTDRLAFAWEAVSENGSYTADKAPEVGKYKLTITLPDEVITKDLGMTLPEGATKDSIKTTVYVEVQKAKLELKDDKNNVLKSGSVLLQINPGKTVSDLTNQIKSGCTLYYKDNAGYKIDKDAVKFDVNVYNIDAADTPLEGAYAFNTTDTGYIVKIAIDLGDTASNYEFEAESQYTVTVGELQETSVKVEYSANAEKAYTREYVEGQQAKEDDLKTAGFNKVSVLDKDEYEITPGEGQLELGWYRREQVATAEVEVTDDYIVYSNDKTVKYIKIDAPENAGEYYAIWKYAGNDKYKASASEPMSYTITPAPIVVTVDKKEEFGTLFKEGMDSDGVDKVLANLDYKINLLTAGNDGKYAKGAEVSVTDEFFGIDYKADDDTSRLYYRPIFKLQYRPKEKKVDDKFVAIDEKADWADFGGSMKKITAKDDSYTYEYRVVITENKGLYYQGTASNKVLITDTSADSADRNHVVNINDNVLNTEAFYEIFNIIEGKKATINTDDIVNAFKSDTTNAAINDASRVGTADAPLLKIYNEEALFANRAAYKAAKYEGADKGELTYTWMQADVTDYDEWRKKSDKEREETPFEKSLKDVPGIDSNYGTTDDAGNFMYTIDAGKIYALKVSYKDDTNEYVADDKYVYFQVDPQEIVIVPADQKAQNGRNIADWLKNSVTKEEYTVYKVPNNDPAQFKVDDANKLSDTLYLNASNKQNKKPITSADFEFEVMQRPKGSQEAFTVKSHEVFDNAAYEYAVTARCPGNTAVIDNSYYAGNGYTSISKALSVGGETVFNDAPTTNIEWIGEKTLYPQIDTEKIAALTKIYDGTASISLAKLVEDKAIVLYGDDHKTDVTKDLLNTDAEYNAEKVNVYWKNGDKLYTNENVVWGGEYSLVLKFEGNKEYKPIKIKQEGDTANGEQYEEFAEYDEAKFSIKRRPLTLKPTLNTNVKAGDEVSKLLALNSDLDADPVEKDKVYFQYSELAKGALDFPYAYIDVYDANGNEQYISYSEFEFNYKNYGYGHYDSTDGSFQYEPFVNLSADGYHYDTKKWGGYAAFDGGLGFVYQVDGKDWGSSWSDKHLRCNRTYTVSFNYADGQDGNNKEWGLIGPLFNSYEVSYQSQSFKVEVRGQGSVESSEYVPNHDYSTTGAKVTPLHYTYDNYTYTIRPNEAVKFYYADDKNYILKVNDKTGNQVKELTNFTGNLIEYRIFAPAEFEDDFANNSKNFIYEAAIKAAGGYVSYVGNEAWVQEMDNNNDPTGRQYMTVLFPLTADDVTNGKSFDITWEEGYTEKFVLTDIKLEADLKEAVAPKSIKFNAVKTKMAVGDTQQLDVKITKKQLADVIKVQYRIAGSENQTSNGFISVDPDTGVVTALKINKKATQIEAYPVKVGKDGKYEPITGKGVKTAKTKIAVTNVTAPSIKKIVMRDVTADVSFTDAGNGYRREIYVIEASGKKTKAEEFESKIAALDKQSYKEAGFAVAPVLSRNAVDKKTKLITERVGSLPRTNDKWETKNDNQLIPGKKYAVYVRNVSAPRTLDDGSTVEFTYNGTVKNFVATKSQVMELDPYFQVNEDNTPVGKSQVKYWVQSLNQDGTENFTKRDEVGFKREYEVPLSAKTAQLSVDGRFWEYEGGNSAAEAGDGLKYALPIKDKTLLAHYMNPKLTYFVADVKNNILEGVEWEDGKIKKSSSKYAKVSNKGKITLKGVDLDGEAKVRVYVQADNGELSYVDLLIKSDATSVTGKKAKLSVGQRKPLADFLEYKNGKKKVPNYSSTGIIITEDTIAAAEAAGYKIEDGYDRYQNISSGDGIKHEYDDWTVGHPTRHYWYITAVSPNKKPFTLNFTDRRTDGTEITVTKPVTLTSTPIQAVKNLKVSYVDDKNITINFKNAGTPEAYEIELLDSSKKVIEKRLIGANEYNIIPKTAPQHIQNYQKWLVSGVDDKFDWDSKTKENVTFTDGWLAYFEKTQTYAYTFSSEKILRRSAYTVNVTPIYGAEMPKKPASKKVKTTDIPAAREYNVGVADPDIQSAGADITYEYKTQNHKVDANGNPLVQTNWNLSGSPYFQAGNVYTLRAADVDDDAKNRVTDTLTWKSSDTKVATIKSRPGTYTATLKALKSGTTTITITSKITKKVIAKQVVKVKAVGNGNGYGGEYEPADSDEFFGTFLAVWDPFYEGRLEVLSAASKLTLSLGAFDRAWVSFTAPAYGQYTFTPKFIDGTQTGTRDEAGIKDIYDAKNGTKFGRTSLFLDANQKVYILVQGAEEGGQVIVSATDTPFARMTTANDKPENALTVQENAYVAFTAPEDNYYMFAGVGGKTDGKYSTDLSALVGYKKGNASEVADWKTEEISLLDKDGNAYSAGNAYALGLKAGETIYIKVKLNAGCKLFVKYRDAQKTLDVASNKKAEVTLNVNTPEGFVRFVAPQAGKYRFNLKYPKDISYTVYGNGATVENGDGNGNYDIAALNADAAADTEKTIFITMRQHQTVIIGFKGEEENFREKDSEGKDVLESDGKTYKYKELKATVEVAADALKPLTSNDKTGEYTGTVSKAEKKDDTTTIDSAATFTFVVPTATTKDRVFEISTDDSRLRYLLLDAEGKDLGEKKDNEVIEVTPSLARDIRFTVNTDKSVEFVNNSNTVKVPALAGKTILIVATNTDIEKDHTITISEKKPTQLTLKDSGKVEVAGVVTDKKYEFTFTAPKAGKYEFKADGGSNAKHTSSLNRNVVDLKEKETVDIVLTVSSVDGVTDTDKTTITVSVAEKAYKEVFNTVGEKTIKVGKGTVEYYKFIVPENDTYTFGFDKTVTVDYKLIASDGSRKTLPDKELSKGSEVEIIVTAGADADVDAKLTISSESAQVIHAGEVVSVKAENTKTEEKYYIFTAENRAGETDDTEYAIVLTKGEKTTGEGKVTIEDMSLTINNNVETFSLGKGQTVKITAKADGTNGEVDDSFVIKAMSPKTPETMKDASTNVSVNAGEKKFYAYTIPEYGIYSIDLTGADENGAVSIDSVDVKGKTIKNDASYVGVLNKGDIVYVKVERTGGDITKPQTGTLKIEKVKDMGESAEVTIAKGGQYAYYLFTAAEHAKYDFNGKVEPAADKASGSLAYLYKVSGTQLINKGVGGTDEAEKGDKYLVILQAAADNASFKYTVTKTPITELKLGEEVSAPAVSKDASDRNVTVAFKPTTKGLYAFEVTNVNKPDGSTQIAANSYFFVKEYTQTNTWNSISLRAMDNSEADVTVKVKVTAVEVIKLTADAEAVSKDIEPGKCVYVQFVPTVKGRYNFTTDNDKVMVSKELKDKLLDANDATFGSKAPIRISAPAFDTTEGAKNEKQSVKLKVETVKLGKTDKTTTFKKPAELNSVWYEFTAPNNGKYTFALTNGKTKEDERYAYGATLYEYEDINVDPEKSSLTSKFMKEGDTVLVKADITELKDKDGNQVAKDTEITFEVTPDKEYTFYEVKFEKNPDAAQDHSREISFKAEKGKTYSIEKVIHDGKAPTLTTFYEDGKKFEKIDDISEVDTKDHDVNIKFEVTLSKEASTEFYIFIKDTTPKAE